MAVVIRMSRGGRRNLPFYRIVVADSRFPRDGRYIERVGTYNPLLETGNENRVTLVKDRIEHWLKMRIGNLAIEYRKGESIRYPSRQAHQMPFPLQTSMGSPLQWEDWSYSLSTN